MSEVEQKNILAIKQHSENTRKLVRELEQKLNSITSLNLKVLELENQVRALQVKVHTGGATSGNN